MVPVGDIPPCICGTIPQGTREVSSPSAGRSDRLLERAVRHHHSTVVRGSPGASAVSLLLLFAVVVSIVLVFAWLAGDGSATDLDTAARLDMTESGSLNTQLPEVGESEREGLTPDDEGNLAATAIAASIDPEELIREYPRTTAKGRVVLLDGGEIPPRMDVEVTRWAPRPTVIEVSVSMIQEGRENSDFHKISDAALRARTRVRVGADGRFEIPDFPLDHLVYIDVSHKDWYQPRPRLHKAPEAGGELLIELSRGASIQGRVVDGNGEPLAGLKLKGASKLDPYAILDGTSVMVKLDSVVSGQDGRFEFTPVPPQTNIVLSVGASGGLQPTTHKVAALSLGEVTYLDIIVLRGGTIEGIVTDSDEQPVPGTSVLIQPSTFSMSDIGLTGMISFDEKKKTDGEGRFRFDSLPEGAYVLSLAKGGYRAIPTARIDVTAGEVVQGIELQADRGLSVSGRVTGPDGEPVVEARVMGFLPPSMFSMRANADRQYRSSEAVDQDGVFTLWGYDQGQVRVKAEADGYVADSVDVAAGAVDIVIQLQRKTAIKGIAIDLSTGEPLTDYQLRILPSDGLLNMAALMNAEQLIEDLRAPLDVSDEDGRFSMDDVPPGTYDIVLIAEGYAQTINREVVVAEDSGANGVIIMVAEEASVTGQAVSGHTGLPVPEVTVTTGKTDAMSTWTQIFSGPVPKTTTDAEGRFTIGGLSNEPVTITLQHADYRSVVLADLLLRPAEVYDAGLVILPPGGMIYGTVYGPDERPVSGVTVMASDAMGTQIKRATTEADGTYAISGLNKGTFSVFRMDFSFSLESDNPASVLEGMTFETVSLELDEVKQVDLGVPSEAGCLLEGVVTSAGGPEEEAMVIVVKENGPPNTKFAGTNDDGHYEIGGLKPGQYLVQVIPSGSMAGGGGQPASPVISTIVIGDETNKRHDIELPGAVLRAEVRARGAGGPLAGVRVLLERIDEGRPASRFIESMGGRVGEAYSDGQGEVHFEHLPAGTYALQAGGSNMVGLGEAGWGIARIDW